MLDFYNTYINVYNYQCVIIITINDYLHMKQWLFINLKLHEKNCYLYIWYIFFISNKNFIGKKNVKPKKDKQS